MLGKGLFVSLFLANVLIISVTGKTLLIETEDEPDKAAFAQGIKEGRAHIKDFTKVLNLFLDYMAVEDEADDADSVETFVPIVEAELELPRPKPVEDWSNIPEPWIKTRKLIEARCQKEKTKHNNFCRKILKIRW